MATNQVAFYPGCSLEGTAACFMDSLRAVLAALGVTPGELQDWNCCGATSAHAMNHELYLALNLRNLALAEQQGFSEIIAPCAACYHRLASTAFELSEDKNLADRIKTDSQLDYRGTVKVRNVLDFVANVIGTAKVARAVQKPLTGLKTVCYYGCLNTRVPRMPNFDDIDYPMSMDRIVEALGAKALNWSYKTECCGASLFLSSESTSAKLVGKILQDAVARGADCIVVACPLCHNNLDTKQKAFRLQAGVEREIPVVFFPQLMGLAFGLPESELKLNHCFVPFELDQIKRLSDRVKSSPTPQEKCSTSCSCGHNH